VHRVRPIGYTLDMAPDSRRRALALLADNPGGCTLDIVFAHGFSAALLIELVEAGLAIAKVNSEMAGEKTPNMTRIRITDAGRVALEEPLM
jgi:hypothetical protein